MKLFTKYSRINLFATVIVFLLSGIAFYFLLRYVLVNQVDEDLKIEQHEIQNYTASHQHLPEIVNVNDQHITYTAAFVSGKQEFKTLHIADGNEKEIFRQLVFYIESSNQWYKVTVSKSLEGTDDMLQSIVTITLITILLILIVTLLINRVVLKKLWQPFYDSLAAMRQFELSKNKPPVFQSATIDEFALMNDTLKQVTTKAHEDYQHLKEFTENASHELQTPLAIIQSKLDVLIQDEQLSEQQSKAVQSAYEAIQRLSRLNQGLLLLTKIENGQFAETSQINIAQKINEKLHQFEEMIASKNIEVSTSLDESVAIKINPALADIMLNNLFSNAIKYNLPGGKIDIIADEGVIEISNTGDITALDGKRLFKRFSKPGMVNEGVGLGLAIVQHAAEVSGLEAEYLFEDNQHHFLLVQKHY